VVDASEIPAIAKLAELGIAQTTYAHPETTTVELQAQVVTGLEGVLTRNLLLKDKKHGIFLVSTWDQRDTKDTKSLGEVRTTLLAFHFAFPALSTSPREHTSHHLNTSQIKHTCTLKPGVAFGVVVRSSMAPGPPSFLGGGCAPRFRRVLATCPCTTCHTWSVIVAQEQALRIV